MNAGLSLAARGAGLLLVCGGAVGWWAFQSNETDELPTELVERYRDHPAVLTTEETAADLRSLAESMVGMGAPNPADDGITETEETSDAQ